MHSYGPPTRSFAHPGGKYLSLSPAPKSAPLEADANGTLSPPTRRDIPVSSREPERLSLAQLTSRYDANAAPSSLRASQKGFVPQRETGTASDCGVGYSATKPGCRVIYPRRQHELSTTWSQRTRKRLEQEYGTVAPCRRYALDRNADLQQPRPRAWFNPSCLGAERCWDQVRWAIEECAWRFDRCAKPSQPNFSQPNFSQPNFSQPNPCQP